MRDMFGGTNRAEAAVLCLCLLYRSWLVNEKWEQEIHEFSSDMLEPSRRHTTFRINIWTI